jgi:hypothetical protein
MAIFTDIDEVSEADIIIAGGTYPVIVPARTKKLIRYMSCRWYSWLHYCSSPCNGRCQFNYPPR